MLKFFIPFALFLSLISLTGFSQGDGPHSFLLAPKGVTGVNAKWLHLDQNILPAQILAPGADIKLDVFPSTLFHTFSIKGRYAQAYLMINPGSVTATATSIPPQIPVPVGTQLKANGFADGFAGFRIGLYGAPALSAATFMSEKMRFSLFADARLWYSGSYDAGKLLNLGSNRQTIQLSLPMAIPLNKNRERATWLEVSPSIEFFTTNNDPSRGNSAKKINQASLFVIENHLSHYFTKKLWGIMSVRFRQGGQTSEDDKKEGNTMSILGTTAGVGYQALPFLGLYADYGKVIYGDKGAKSDMFRVTVTFAYANLKKK